jgi:spore coat polysaccharide biosynthesis predicted glycosyltransferase SpsG
MDSEIGAEGCMIQYCTYGDALTGMGHVVRCQALAQYLESGHDITVCDHPPGYVCERRTPLRVQLVDLLSEAQQGYDLTFSSFDCPEYAVLRPQFNAKRLPHAKQGISRVLMSFGGSDPADLLSAATHALADTDLYLSAVLGPAYRDAPEYRARWAGRVAMYNGPVSLDNDMAGHMADHDLLLCSGGMTVLEAACIGLPTVVMSQNDREHERRLVWQHWYSGMYLGLWHEVKYKHITNIVQWLRVNPALCAEMSRNGQARVDGLGAKRVAQAIQNIACPGGYVPVNIAAHAHGGVHGV